MAITVNASADLSAWEDTSTSSNAIPTTNANLTFTVSGGKSFTVADTVQVTATAASIPTGVIGTVSSYSGTSLVMTPTGFYSLVFSKTTGTVGTGSKTFVVGVRPEFTAGLTAGLAIRIHHRTSPFTNYMTGTITSFTAATRSLVVNVTATAGTVTQSDWVIVQSGTFTAWDVGGQWGDTINDNNAAILTVTSTPKTKFKFLNALTNAQLQVSNASTSTPLILRGNEPTGSNSPTNTGLRFEQNAMFKITGGWISLGTGSNTANQAFTIPTGINYPGYVEVETGSGTGVYVPWKIAPTSYDYTILNWRKVAKAEVTNNAIVGSWLFYDPSTRQVSCGDGTNGLLIPSGANVRVPNIHLGCDPTTPTTVSAAIGDSNCTGSVSTGTGSKSFTVATGLSYAGGGTESILLERIGDASYYGTGTVTTYTSGTGAMTVNITSAQAPTTASFSDWRILDQRGFTITSTDSNTGSLPTSGSNWWRSGERITATRTGTSMGSVTRNTLHVDGIPLMAAGDLVYYVADAAGSSGNGLRAWQIDTAPSGSIDWTGVSWEWGMTPDLTDPASTSLKQCGGPTMVYLRSSFGTLTVDNCTLSAACESAQYNGLRVTSVLGTTNISRLSAWNSHDDGAGNATNLIYLSNVPTLAKYENLEAYVFRRVRSAQSIYYDTVFLSGAYTPNNIYCIGGQIAILGCANQDWEGIYIADSPDGTVALAGSQQHFTHTRNSNLILRKWRCPGSMKLGANQITSGDAFSNLIYMHDFDFTTGSNATSVTGMCSNSGTSNMVIANANMGTVSSGFANTLNRATSNLVEKNVVYRNIRTATAGTTGTATGIPFSNGFFAEYVVSGQAFYNTAGGSIPSYKDTQNYMATIVPARTTGVLSVGPFGGQSALSLYDFTGTSYVNNAGRLYLEADLDSVVIKCPYPIRSITSFQNVAPTVVGANTGSLTLEFREVDWGQNINAASWQTLNATNLAAVTIADNTIGINMQVRVTGSGAVSGRYLDVIQLATNNNSAFQPSVTTFNVGVTGAPNGATLAVYDTSSGSVLRGTATVASGAASVSVPAELYGVTVPVAIKLWLYGYIPFSATSSYYNSSITSAVSMSSDTAITQANAATVAAYTDLSAAGRIYDACQLYAANNLIARFCSKSGSNNDFGSLNVVFDATAAQNVLLSGGTLTLKAATVNDNFITTGTVSFTNGAVAAAALVYTSSAGTSVPVTAPNLISGTRIRLYNVTDATELDNAVIGSGGYVGRFTWTANKTIQLRAAYINGMSAKHEIQVSGVLTNTGATFLDSQTDETVYNANGVDGSTCTEFATDYANIQVDVSDPDGVTTVQRLYAWYHYIITTANGIRNFFLAMEAPDTANYVIDQSVVDLKLDNVSGTPVRIIGGYLARKDGTTVIAATSGSIQMDPFKAYIASTSSVASAVWSDATGAAVATKTDELHRIHGLKSGETLTVTPTSRVAGTITQTIGGNGTTLTTVSRA